MFLTGIDFSELRIDLSVSIHQGWNQGDRYKFENRVSIKGFRFRLEHGKF